MLQFLNGAWVRAVAIGAAALAVAGGIYKAGRDGQKVSQYKQKDRLNADETKVRNDVGSLSADAARRRLRDKWVKR